MYEDNRRHLANVYRRRNVRGHSPTFVQFTQQLVIPVVLCLRFTTNANRRPRHLPPNAADVHDMLFEHLILPTIWNYAIARLLLPAHASLCFEHLSAASWPASVWRRIIRSFALNPIVLLSLILKPIPYARKTKIMVFLISTFNAFTRLLKKNCVPTLHSSLAI